MAAMKDVAALAHVDVSTVPGTLGNTSYVHPDTRARKGYVHPIRALYTADMNFDAAIIAALSDKEMDLTLRAMLYCFKYLSSAAVHSSVVDVPP